MLGLVIAGIVGFGMLNVLAYRQWGFNGFAHNPVEYATALKCPALFMHGANDSRATVAEGHRVFAVVPGPKQFKEFASVGHAAYVSTYPQEWRSAVAQFLKTAAIKSSAGR